MVYVKNFFILVGLFLVSQISMMAFGIAKELSQGMGETNLSLVASIMLIIIVIGNIWVLIFLGKKLGFFNLKLDFFTKRNVGIILGGFILARVIAIGGTFLLNTQGTESTANDAAIQTMFSGENPLLIILLIGISAPIMEEIVFRGGIIGFWLGKFPILGIAVSSILFGLMHGPTNLISFLLYGLVGLILSVAYYKTQRLEISISIHFLNNILAAIAMAFGLI
ncbi:CPBP family intramembrane metalloprotease [Enterococcus plantarum]|uniref:CPBP family intramembrane metalloprotease n=1 Tax=Enterococcus plantarum TaxID=1077675 RepID=A0A2W3ZPV9_9ENTE|nr:type II CAAX endopeptidase family protein [Enterococcus plantarum]PZL70913.1 CPBP family intramembrane metalloprotease [Enterococcus plantarum]